MTKSEFKQYIINNPSFSREVSVKRHFPDFFSEVQKLPGESWKEKLYNYVWECPHHICPECGKVTTFETFAKGYHTYCSNECASKSKLAKQKAKQTCLERYGVENARQSAHAKQKAKQTCLERYGVENPSQNETVKNKKKQRAIEKYGVENVSQSVEVVNRIAQTHIERYGEKNIMRVKARQKYPDIIGFDGKMWICSCPHPECSQCHEKTYITTRQLYVDRKKVGAELCTRLLPKQPTYSSGELMIRGWLDELGIEYDANQRSVIPPKELDIYIPKLNLAIEFNGSYHHSPDKDSIYKTLQETKYIECQNKGISLIQIWDDEIKTNADEIKQYIRSLCFGGFTNVDDYDVRTTRSSVTIILSKFPANIEQIVQDISSVFKHKQILIQTDNDKIPHKLMAKYKFVRHMQPKRITRTIKGHGSYPTYNSGASIWTI